jgi:predicted permease
MITILGIYIFIVIGFFAKKFFKEIDGKTLVILSTYFLQPFLTLWGIMLVPINFDLILSPLVYLIAVFFALIFTFLFSLSLINKKEKIIVALTPLIGNTGNLGIPLNYVLFGDVGASIATIINLANIFFIYSFGIFFFASGKYNFKVAFKKIVKIPVLWFGIIALILNISGIGFNKDVLKILQMGAFASIVVQLLIFGIYVAEIQTREVNFKLAFFTTVNKFIVFPFVSFFVLKFFNLKPLFFKAIMLEILTPLAITNVNLSALFDLYPRKVAMLVILTSIIFIGVVFVFF